MSSQAAACITCGFTFGESLAMLDVSELCFVSDRRFPGRCVVTLRQHATELYDLSRETRSAFVDDMSRAAHAIMLAVGGFKMNYEILGNASPHVHCHLIPRRQDEPGLKLPAWLHPQAQEELADDAAKEIKQSILTRLRKLPVE